MAEYIHFRQLLITFMPEQFSQPPTLASMLNRPRPGRSHVFTYGTLMFDGVWRRVVGESRNLRFHASLAGHYRYRVKGQHYPALVPDHTATNAIDGVLYSHVSARDLALLDCFEGPQYRRQRVTVACGQEAISCFVYLWRPSQSVLLDAKPWLPDEFLRCGLIHFSRLYQGFSKI